MRRPHPPSRRPFAELATEGSSVSSASALCPLTARRFSAGEEDPFCPSLLLVPSPQKQQRLHGGDSDGAPPGVRSSFCSSRRSISEDLSKGPSANISIYFSVFPTIRPHLSLNTFLPLVPHVSCSHLHTWTCITRQHTRAEGSG